MIWATGIRRRPAGGPGKWSSASMTKAFHAGRAAQNGLTAALLASCRISRRTMRRWKCKGWLGPGPVTLASTGRKSPMAWAPASRPHSTPTSRSPRGIVTHPAIDAAIQLSATRTSWKPGDIATIELIANPLVLKPDRQDRTPKRAWKASSAFISLHRRRADLRRSRRAPVPGCGGARDPAAVVLRRKVTVHVDPKGWARRSVRWW